MKSEIAKAIAATVLFVAWAAIVFDGKTNVPGAETLIAWIQGALAALVGVHMYRVGANAEKDKPTPQQPSEPEKSE